MQARSCVFVVCCFAFSAHAQVQTRPSFVYEGFLTVDGVPSNDDHLVDLLLIDENENVLYADEQVVEAIDGRFTMTLNDISFDIYDRAQVFVALSVDGLDLEGLQELHPVPYATSAGGSVDFFSGGSLTVGSSESPSLFLERDGEDGLTPQTWMVEVDDDEGSFNVIDITNGFLAPLVLRPGAPSDSIVVDDDGEVGIGTGDPLDTLHIVSSQGDAKLRVEEQNGTTAARELLELSNNGAVALAINDRSQAGRWRMLTSGTSLRIDREGNGIVDLELASGGNLTINGALTQNSDRRLKRDLVIISDALARLQQLRGYSYVVKASGEKNIGVVAQEVADVFPEAVRVDAEGMMSVSYTALVAPLIEAVRALDDENDALADRVQKLERELKQRDARLDRIEALLIKQQKK